VTRVSGIVWLVAAIQLGFGLAALALWAFRVDAGFFTSFFPLQSSFFLLVYAVLGYLLSLACWRQFESGEPLRWTWLLIASGSGCRVIGLIVSNFVGGLASPNIGADPAPAATTAAALREMGSTFGGPLNMVLLAAGLLVVVGLYKKVGLLRRPSLSDWIPLGLVGLFIASQLVEFARWNAALREPATILKWIGWITDPLLGLLLLEALLLRRAILNSGGGLIARCWRAYAAAIFLTSVGNAGSWAVNTGLLNWRYHYCNAFIWFLAAIAFALGPAYQFEAILGARRARH
jgi:hypothetical protein